MLVWTVAVLTQFGSTVKEDRKVENTRRKNQPARALGEPSPGMQNSPKVGHLQSQFRALGPGGCG